MRVIDRHVYIYTRTQYTIMPSCHTSKTLELVSTNKQTYSPHRPPDNKSQKRTVHYQPAPPIIE